VNELPPSLHAAWTGVREAGAVAFVRPHDIELRRAPDSSARIESIRDLGASVRLEVRHPALAAPLVALYERARFTEIGLEATDAVDLTAARWIIFPADR
jgi:sulfate transport system ATP-binding protein